MQYEGMDGMVKIFWWNKEAQMPILGQRGVDLDKIGIKWVVTSRFPPNRIVCTLQLSFVVSVQFDMKIPPRFGIPTDPVLNEQILRHAGKISYASFQVSGVKNSMRNPY